MSTSTKSLIPLHDRDLTSKHHQIVTSNFPVTRSHMARSNFPPPWIRTHGCNSRMNEPHNTTQLHLLRDSAYSLQQQGLRDNLTTEKYCHTKASIISKDLELDEFRDHRPSMHLQEPHELTCYYRWRSLASNCIVKKMKNRFAERTHCREGHRGPRGRPYRKRKKDSLAMAGDGGTEHANSEMRWMSPVCLSVCLYLWWRKVDRETTTHDG